MGEANHVWRWDYMENFRQELWSGLPCSSPRDFHSLGIKPASLVSPALAGGFLITEPPRKPQMIMNNLLLTSPS